MLITPLFAVTRDNSFSKKIWYLVKFRTHILWFLVSLLVSLTLLVAEQNHLHFTQNLRILLMDSLAPIVDTTSHSFNWVRSSIENLKDILNTHARNKLLIAENNNLLKWQELAYRLKAENQVLRQQLHIIKESPSLMLTARVISYPSNLWTKNILIKVGKREGVKKDQPVVANNALVGRIIEVGKTTSRVLLITDHNSHIPVILESTRMQAIGIGANSSLLKLMHFEKEEISKIEGRVLTSGKGGIFPPGLLLGIIKKIESEYYIKSPIPIYSLEYVHVLTTPSIDSLENRNK